jgi:1-acyl-sn-glycerol-3-phosphate acyltransferase
MRALASIFAWLSIAIVVVVGFFMQLSLGILTLPFDRRRVVVGRFFRLMGVVASKLVPTWSFGVEGTPPRSIRGRTVVVSNHASHADPFLISHLPWEMKWLGKSSLFKVPLLGWSMWIAGDIPIKRGRGSSIEDAMKRCAAWLAREMPVMIFPEGTRSQTGELGAFKDGAFRLAIDTGADILPVAVAGTHDALPKHSWMFGKARARVTVGTPISTAGMTQADLERLKSEARAQIEALRAKLASVTS